MEHRAGLGPGSYFFGSITRQLCTASIEHSGGSWQVLGEDLRNARMLPQYHFLKKHTKKRERMIHVSLGRPFSLFFFSKESNPPGGQPLERSSALPATGPAAQ